MNFARVVTFLLLVSACVAAQTTRRLVYLCDNTAHLPLKNPSAIPDPFKPEPVGGHINLSQINPPLEFQVRDLTAVDTKAFSAFLIRFQRSCQSIYADVDAKGGMQIH